MTVMLTLTLIVAAFSLCFVGAVAWALTRGKDRIQMATICLFVCALSYFVIATQLYSRGGSGRDWGVLVGAYSLWIYVAVAALGIFSRRWAWQAAIGAFLIHLAAAVFGVVPAAQLGNVGYAALLLWVLLGAVGLWACLHRGSRKFAFLPRQSEV